MTAKTVFQAIGKFPNYRSNPPHKDSRAKGDEMIYPSAPIKTLLYTATALIFVVLSLCGTTAAQVGNLRVILTGREMPPNIRAEQRGEQILLPVVAIARELGYAIIVDQTAETIRVRRVGIEAEFIKQTGEIRENGVTIVSVPFANETVFNVNLDNLRLPIETVAALLNVSVVIDQAKGAVRIDSRDASSATTSQNRGGFEIGGLNYNYSSNFAAGYYYQNLNLVSNGRIGSSTYLTNVNFSGGSGSGFLNFFGGNFTLRRKQKDELQFGDLSTSVGSELSLLNVLVRGASYSRPMFAKRIRLSLYGGRSFSGVSDFRRQNGRSLNFDTTLIGSRLSFNAFKPNANSIAVKNLYLTGGGAYFNGKHNKGVLFDTAARYNTEKFTLDVEAAVGAANTLDGNNVVRKGFGYGLIVNGSYKPWRFLSVQGRYEFFNPNFATPSRTAQFNNRQTKSVGLTLQPFRNLSFGASASLSENKNPVQIGSSTIDNVRTESYTANVGYDPEVKFLPRMSINATTIKSPIFGNLTFVFANFAREYENFRPFANYTLTSSKGTTGHGISLGASINAGELGQFQAQQGFSLSKSPFLRENPNCLIQPTIQCSLLSESKFGINSLNGNLDWTPKNPLFGRVQFGVGGGYVKNYDQLIFQFRANAAVVMLFKQNFQVSYYRSAFGNELRFALAGPLAFWKPKQLLNEQVTNEEVLTVSTVQGRVYLDNNFNREYDPGTDTPMSGVKVHLNNGLRATTDAAGNYSFYKVPPGEHKIAVNYEDIRADLVPANGLEQNIVVMPRSVVTTAFRMVKSGAIAGRVWHDANADGKYDAGEGLGDIRVLTSSGKDTYTDPDGTFLISELPPGEQTVYIDERYQPEDLTAPRLSLRIEVRPDATAKTADFLYKIKPREIREKIFEPNSNSGSNPAARKDK